MIHPRYVGIAAAFLLTVWCQAATAETSTPSTTCVDGTTSTATGKGACSHHGGVAKAAAAAPAPAGATAKCKDGTYSMSKTRSGTCSKHGGVDQWLATG